MKAKDRIDALVDMLDTHHFRIGAADMMLAGSTYGEHRNWVDGIRGQFKTKSGEEARELFYENLKEAEEKVPGITAALEDAALQWLSGEETFPMLLGFILGLRTAGIDSERTKQMARTWRIGCPQDDEGR